MPDSLATLPTPTFTNLNILNDSINIFNTDLDIYITYPIKNNTINVNNINYIIMNPPEENRTRSTTFALNGNTLPPIYKNNQYNTISSMLDVPDGWSAQNNDEYQWLQFKLNTPTLIAGTITQSRGKGIPNSGAIDLTIQKVTQYMVQYSTEFSETTNPKNWVTVVNNNKIDDDNKLFLGNQKEDTINNKVGNLFPTPIVARYIRILPQKYLNHISMRAGLLTVGGGDMIIIDKVPIPINTIKSLIPMNT